MSRSENETAKRSRQRKCVVVADAAAASGEVEPVQLRDESASDPSS